MAYRVLVRPEHRCVLYHIYGTFNIDDCQNSKAEAMAHQAFDLGYTQITDLSDVVQFDTNFSGVSQAASVLSELLKDAPAEAVNYILAPEDVHFGLARMYQQLMDGKSPLQVIVVRSRAELAHCIDLEDDQMSEMFDQAAKA